MEQKIVDKFIECLQENKMKCTPERISVLEEVYKSKNHFEAEDIFFSLRGNKTKNVSRATVYRTLDLLVENGFVNKVNLGTSQLHYESVIGRERHEHLVCTQCGKIIEFFDNTIEKRQEKICKEHDFLPTKHNMIIFGLCQECQRRKG